MTLVRATEAAHDPALPPPLVQGEAIVYRLYDVGYEIDLDRAFDLLGGSAPERARPVRGQAQAIQILNPPVTARLGVEKVTIEGEAREVEFSARVFDFGVVSIRARVAATPDLRWDEYVHFGLAVASTPAWRDSFGAARDRLMSRIGPAVRNPGEAPVSEDYVVFRVHRLADEEGRRLPLTCLADDDVARLLVGESRPLSPAWRRDLLSQRFSYFEDDLAVLAWNSALVVEPVAEDTDVQYVLEFANAQLLELRFYDATLDRELPRIYDRIEEARHGFHFMGRRYSRLLSSLQTRVADATELVERVENSLKVTDDVFLARIYAAALEIFRGRTWRSGIDGKLAIIRDAYSMLNAESQARRAEILEIIIVLLIGIELVLGLLKR
ncbi:MAG TPA: hypothetical protein VMJ70_01350 [Candidatus Sulfotelmatobacter sp.]|nr:hypothetical protein [Candidatus Sulfotelmatobacter sp.]